MRTLGHREGNNTHRSRSGWRGRVEQRGARGGWRGITPGEMPDVGDSQGGMDAANHHGMYVPMQQSCRMQDVYMYPTAQSTI